MKYTYREVLSFSSTLRLLSILILLIPNIHPFFKVLLIYILDALDGRLIKQNDENATTYNLLYQRYDKIVDSVINIIIFIYFISLYPNNIFNLFILGLLIFRLIGVYLFVTENNPAIVDRPQDYLLLFPDFFRDVILFLFLVEFFKCYYGTDDYFFNNQLLVVFVIFAIMFFKVYQEQLIHNRITYTPQPI